MTPRLFAALLLAAWLCSCSLAPLKPTPPVVSFEAARRIDEILQHNRGLRAFKGVGSLRLWQREAAQNVRAAWIAVFPDRMRLELIGPTGIPVASMAADGADLRFYMHDSREFYRHPIADRGLRRLLGIDMTVDEVVALLGGRIELADFRTAGVEGGVLLLEDDEGRILQKVYPAAGQERRRVLESFDDEGSLRYRAVLASPKPANGFAVPGTLQVTAGQGAGFRLSVDRTWPNPEIPAGAFVLIEDPAQGATGR